MAKIKGNNVDEEVIVLDPIDHQIIEMLQIDGRMSIRDIADKTESTPVIVRNACNA